MIRIAVSALAVWRLTHLIVLEDGPGAMIVRLRKRAGSGQLGELMDCFYCASVWVALPFAWRTAAPAETWMALSGAACLLEQATQPKEQT